MSTARCPRIHFTESWAPNQHLGIWCLLLWLLLLLLWCLAHSLAIQPQVASELSCSLHLSRLPSAWIAEGNHHIWSWSIFIKLYLSYVYECFTCMYVHHVGAWCLWRPDKSAGSPDTGLTVDCETPCRCWESNPSPLQKSDWAMSPVLCCFFKVFLIHLFYYLWVYVCAMCVWCPWGQKRVSDLRWWSYKQLWVVVWVRGVEPGPH